MDKYIAYVPVGKKYDKGMTDLVLKNLPEGIVEFDIVEHGYIAEGIVIVKDLKDQFKWYGTCKNGRR